MSQSIKLSDQLLEEARRHAELFSRSVPKQIEYWSRIGKLAEENPDLPYGFIREILLSQQSAEEGSLSDYQFG
jgi:hypothetical protein